MPKSSESGSWIALVAETLGMEGACTVLARVRADEDLVENEEYRLVVHSYDEGAEHSPAVGPRPVGSTQRAVTAAELRRGVDVSVVELRSAARRSGAVVAWIEAGRPDLELDARLARPRAGSMIGRARRSAAAGPVQIRLTRRMAA